MTYDKKSQKPVNGAGLHNFIATGGNPKDYKRSRGLSSETVPNIPDNKNKNA